MKILGIETSCDETAASVVRDGRDILSNIVSSSLKEHQKYGGIIPEIASRRQMELIHGVVKEALLKAETSLDEVDAIAVTASPGLIGSLLVGISFARALAFATRKPLIEVDHVKAHLYANFLVPAGNTQNGGAVKLPRLPAIGLVASGGHSSIYQVKSFKDFRLLGQTRDDAAGEAFDKVARILGLGYPGGPVIDKLAQKGANNDVRFRCASMPDSMDFSFSGVKTAVLYYTKSPLYQRTPVEKIAYAFQDSVVSALVTKCIAACQRMKIKTLLVGGGVAANSALRVQLRQKAEENGIAAYFPPMNLCVDNAAMIAGWGYHLFRKN